MAYYYKVSDLLLVTLDKSISSANNLIFLWIKIYWTVWNSTLQIRVLINTSGAIPNFPADLLALRMASFNQVLDPWLYILLRKEMLVRIYEFYRKKRYGVISVSPCNSTDSASGSMRLQPIGPQQKKFLKKMNSTDSNTTTTTEMRIGWLN